MIDNLDKYDVTIIGGGLSGLCAALALGKVDVKVALIDRPVDSTGSGMGGFARFSGAKFSLPPAGLGLLPLVGSRENLSVLMNNVLDILGLLGRVPERSRDFNANFSDQQIGLGVSTRNYDSIVLTPSEMGDLIARLTEQVNATCRILEGECLRISGANRRWDIEYQLVQSPELSSLSSTAVFFAGGRSSSRLIIDVGCKETGGKGLDLGVRVEFPSRQDLKALRDLGPDAKVLADNCRTFCLNVPGHIYRYSFDSIMIPGGVVAEPSHTAGNVGLLYRHPNKALVLQEIINKAKSSRDSCSRPFLASTDFLGGAAPVLDQIYGSTVVGALNSFSGVLQELGLVCWTKPHYVHLPLLDWHWPTFCLPGTFRTGVKGIYVLGDSSGHARGLLQAAASGHIAAQEFLA